MVEKPLATNIHDEWKAITDEIKRLEGIIEDNKKRAKVLHSQNSHMRETIKILKQKRTEAMFAATHIRRDE